MARRTKYHVDTQTRILDSHKQFMGGLKTVDTDDSLKGFFLRDAENISLSEYGFLERRYGLVNDANFEFPLPGVQQEFIDPLTGVRTFKDRLQGYFEYVRQDGVTETIIFYNGKLYLNKVQITKLYKYPQQFDPKLGIFNNNINEEDFKRYLERVHNYTDFDSFNVINDLFNTGREIEGVRIENRMFFFTGVYPIIYEGTGEFYIMPEFQTNFLQLALFSHNLHAADLDKTYTEGFPASDIEDVDLTELDKPYFGDIGYAPMFPFMVGADRGLDLTVNFKIPEVFPFTLQESSGPVATKFQKFLISDAPQSTPQQHGQYVELIPEVYYRPVGLAVPQEERDLSADRTWTRLEQSDVQYFFVTLDDGKEILTPVTNISNIDTTFSGFTPNNFTYLNDDKERELTDKYRYPSFFVENRLFTENGNLLPTIQPLLVSELATRKLRIKLTGLPSRTLDIRIDYVVRQAGYERLTSEQSSGERFVEKIVSTRREIFPNITITSERTQDYLQFIRLPRLEFLNFAAFPITGLEDTIYVALDTSFEYIWDVDRFRIAEDSEKFTKVPVNDPAGLWTCNKVINRYGKLMAYGSKISPDRLFIGHPQFLHYFPFFFTRDFQSDDQKPILQITPFMNILVVQNETYSWGLKGIDAVLGAENFYTPFVISPIYGTIAPKSVRPVRNQLFFLSADGIVSIQSLYAIDEQYNVKHMDKNIENIVPLDPEAVAIQYDNQYWIHFPNTPEFLTLRYHLDMRAWMKDTYFQFDGLDEKGIPNKSKTIFNGIYKYIRKEDKLIFITNPMKFSDKVSITEAETNYRIFKLYVDYSMATDLGETPRTLFETSYLDQDYPFNEKRYMEQKMDFTIQNEYHLGKEPIFRAESMKMVKDLGNDATGNPIHQFAMYRLPLAKNHDYQINVPGQGGAPIVDPNDSTNVIYPNQKAGIKAINVRLFDIQGNLLRTLNFQDQKPATPSILNLQTFVANKLIQFRVYNNDIVFNNIRYRLTSTAPGVVNPIEDAIISSVESNRESSVITIQNVPFGPLTLEVSSTRPNTPGVESEKRIRHFQLEDGVFDIFVFNPIAPSLAPLALSALPKGQNNIADKFEISWVDQNPGSTSYRVQFRNLTTGSGILGSKTETTTSSEIDFSNLTSQQLEDIQGHLYQIEVTALFNGNESIPAVIIVGLEIFTEVPGTVGPITVQELNEPTIKALRFNWADVNFESNYQVEWNYAGETLASGFANREPDRKVILSQNSINYSFAVDTSQPNFPLIDTNAVIDFRIRGVNANGQSAQDTFRQGVYRVQYDHSKFVGTPINVEAGFRVTIPDARKNPKYGTANTVFEHAWGAQIRKKGVTAFDAERVIVAEGNNFFEIKNLEPETVYEVRVRGRYNITDTAGNVISTFLPFEPALGLFEVTTGDEVLSALATPTITNLQVNVPSHDATVSTEPQITLNFTLTNPDSRKARVHYVISNAAGGVAVPQSPPFTAELDQNQTQSLTVNIPSRAGSDTQQYVHAKSYPVDPTKALESAIRVSPAQFPPAFVVAEFRHNNNLEASRYGFTAFTVTSSIAPALPAGTIAWSPSLPRTINIGDPQPFVFNSVAETLPTHPVPTGLDSTTITSTSIQLVWNAVSGVTNYDVRVNQSTILFASSNSLNVTGLDPGTSYTFEVRSRANATGNASAFSASITRSTTSAAQAPAAPSSVSISSPGDNQVSFNWPAVSGATSYNWEVLFDGAVVDSGSTTTVTSVTRSGIPAGSVRARVQACNANGCSAFTNSQFVTVGGVTLG